MTQQQYPPQQNAGGQPQPGMQHGGQMAYGPGIRFRTRRDYPIETKPFFLTSEFMIFAAATLALAINVAVDKTIDARFFWIIEAVFVGLYMVARGLAKAGTKSRSVDPREQLLAGDGSDGGGR